MWSNFHKLQFSRHIHDLWATYLTAIHIPPALQGEAKLLLQLLLDRLLKCLIAAEASGCSSTAVPELHRAPTLWEQNVIQYMAGYVVRKLKRQFKVIHKQPEIQKKRDLFLCVLSAMESKEGDVSCTVYQEILAAIKFGEMDRNHSDKYLMNLKFGDSHDQ